MNFRSPVVPGLDFWQRYERVLDKLEKNRRDVERHWKQLRRRLIDYEEKQYEEKKQPQEEQSEEQGEDSGPALRKAAGQ